MRHRLGMATSIGLGNPDKCLLNNQWSENEKINELLKKICEDVIPLYFSEFDGCDFQINESKDGISFYIGIEPAYKMDKLIWIMISSNKNDSYIRTGIAYGFYGSNIVSKSKSYGEYIKQSKFTRFIDKWHPELIKLMEEI